MHWENSVEEKESSSKHNKYLKFLQIYSVSSFDFCVFFELFKKKNLFEVKKEK